MKPCVIYLTSLTDSDKSIGLCVFFSDIDECSDWSTADGPPCSSGTVCVNVPGSYRCSNPSSAGCMDPDPVTGQCLGVRPGLCQTGMTFDFTAGLCVGKGFLQRAAMLSTVLCYSISVRLSVCPSHAGIVSKRVNVG